MTVMRIVVALALILAGCVRGEYLYLWQCPEGQCERIARDSQDCLTETRRSYSPIVAGYGPKLTLYSRPGLLNVRR